ncbi:MAG: ABC-2 type transport system permease protein [Flavobacteriaceae bacterium]|jgi:ABC-2 type transport system permease protein
MTFLTPIIMVGIFTLVAYLSQLNNDNVNTIQVLDESGLFVNLFENTESIHFEKLSNVSLIEAKINTEESEKYGLLYIPKVENIDGFSESIVFFSTESPSLIVMKNIEDEIEEKVNDLKLKEAGIDSKAIKELRVYINTKQETFQGQETSKLGSILKLAFGGAAGYLLFMFIIIYGNMIMRSVIEEKTSRIIEIIISSVKPIKLLLGKIIGTSLAGITQFLAWVILLGILSTVVSLIFGIDPTAVQASQQEMLVQNSELNSQEMLQTIIYEIYALPLANLIIMFLLFFIGGYLLYSSLYAAIGAAVDSETDTQQFMLPVLLPLIIGIYVGFFTVIENPHGTVSQIFSFIPFTSPVVMLMRIPFGVPLWQQILSLLILFATFIGTVWFAAKIYRVGILMYGKKASYKELLKWLKY